MMSLQKNVQKCLSHWLHNIGNIVLLAKRSNEWLDFVEIMARHCREEMVLDLEIQVSREPVVEERFLQIACCS